MADERKGSGLLGGLFSALHPDARGQNLTPSVPRIWGLAGEGGPGLYYAALRRRPRIPRGITAEITASEIPKRTPATI
jgi:hypothetical protein